MTKTYKNKNNQGFTLIEMALVMIIGGVLLSFMGSALLTYVQKSRIDKTEYRMTTIKEALSQYLSINRKYPCPARRDIAPGVAPASGDKAFGLEVDPNCSQSGNAVNGPAGSTIRTGPVRIGSVPTRTLNLPDDMALDGWGKRFTYAVTHSQATINGGGNTYTNDGGAIEISDSSGTVFIERDMSATPPQIGAQFVIVSHGPTGEGAYDLQGNLVIPCNSGASDNENCDNDDRFRTTLVNSDTGASFFDDYVYYQGQTVPALLIPQGAVMAFNLTTCPDGWTEFTEAEGRFVVGANDGIAPNPLTRFKDYQVTIGTGSSSGIFPIAPYTTAGNANTTNHNFNQGQTQDRPDSSLIPPYVALRYCEKLPG